MEADKELGVWRSEALMAQRLLEQTLVFHRELLFTSDDGV